MKSYLEERHPDFVYSLIYRWNNTAYSKSEIASFCHGATMIVEDFESRHETAFLNDIAWRKAYQELEK